jgi:hypothetical protein
LSCLVFWSNFNFVFKKVELLFQFILFWN